MKLNFSNFRFFLAVAAALAASTVSTLAQSANATISDVPSGSSFDYTVTLFNSGSDSLNSFWYGWTQNGNNLPATPASAGNSTGWDDDISGNSIMWVNSTGTALGPGQTATFTFVSSSPPSAIETAPSGESVDYVGGIDFSQGNPGDSTGVITPAPVATPEPSTFSLLAVGALGLSGVLRRKIRR